MQLREIEIDRFGIWQDVTLPFNERGVTVLYGPNEAGKSTLLRFIRGVLYGYLPHDERAAGPDAQPIECSGTLRLQHHGKEYRLRRTSQSGTRGRLEINGRIVRDDDPLLLSLVSDTREQMFQNIFAIGLPELQQLATLNGDEVAQHIYGLSLGPEGEQIFRAHKGFQAEEQKIVNPEEKNGELFTHLNRLSQLDKELAKHAPVTAKHDQLQDQYHTLEDQIASEQARRQEAEYDLRSRQFVNRIWSPWQKERQLRVQLADLPQGDIDREILSRYDQLELEHSEINERRQSLIAEAKKLQEEADAIPTRPELEENACAIQNLFENSRIMQALDRSLATAESERNQTHSRVNDLLSKLEGNWDTYRLEKTEIGPAAYQRLWTQANIYRSASRTRARLIKRHKKLSGQLRTLRAEWKSYTRDLGKLTIPETRKALLKRLNEMEDLRGLKIRREHLRKAMKLLHREIGPTVIRRELPPFFWLVHSFFMLAGMVLVAAGIFAGLKGYTGIVAGGATAWVVGSIFILLGVASMGTVWAMKEYFEVVEFSTPDIDKERETLELELHRTEQAIDRILRRDAAYQPPPPAVLAPGPQPAVPVTPEPPPAPLSDDEVIRRIREQLNELDRHEPTGRRIDDLRTRLSQLRQTIQEQQRHHGRVRRDWTDTLRRLGFSETLKVSQAFEQCQRLSEARQMLKDDESHRDKEVYQRQELETYLRQVRDLAVKLESPDFRYTDPYDTLAHWDRELKLQAERRRERTRLRQTAKEKRQQAAQLVEQIDKMRRERTVLLKRLGVGDRDEIILKLAAIDERNTLEHQISALNDEIQKLVEADANVALVEDDLIEYDQASNNDIIERRRNEINQIDSTLRSLQGTLEKVRAQLREIENDRTLSSLRFDREQVVFALRESAEK
ncbi:MAG TPA: AAA family ATPase, partial [Planctomicrobium sp.]|nr:AAA family ATPase [Planctomicrobium sp.]